MRLDTQQLAWLVLETLHRTQGKDTTVPLVDPTNLGLTWGTYTITLRGWSGARRGCRTKRQHSMRPVGVGLKKSVTWST
jgi:hypothetical protein